MMSLAVGIRNLGRILAGENYDFAAAGGLEIRSPDSWSRPSPGKLGATVNFDEEIDRSEVPALKFQRNVLGEGEGPVFAGSVADMDFAAPPPVVDALRDRLRHEIFGYEAVPEGLLDSLSNWHGSRHRWPIDSAHVLRAPNILNALAVAVSMFTRPGDGVIVQPPVFFDFFDIVRDCGRRVVRNALRFGDGRYRMDLQDLEQKAAEPDTRMILLCNPHNPVGRVWSKEELRALGAICARHNVLVVSDEMHGDIVYSGRRYVPFPSLSADFADNAITCLSPGKCFNIAGCCAAFTVIADPQKRETFQAENSRLTVNKNNAFANVAMEAAYRHAGPWLDAVLDYLEGNVALVRTRLRQIPGIELIEPEGTFLLWLDCRGMDMPQDALMRFLREQAGWVVTCGNAFGDEGTGFVRMNIGCPRTRLLEALTRLSNAVRSAS